MQRIAVVGTSGSGKTTTAQHISRILGIPHIELDALYWQENWTETPTARFRAKVEAALIGESWVIDGNYSKVRDVVWSKADTVIWLDYSLLLTLWRINKRTLRRSLTRQTLWHGNRETLWKHFFTRDSLYWWVLKTYSRRKREYPELFAQPDYAHLQVLHFCTPRQTQTWLDSLTPVHRSDAGKYPVNIADNQS